MLDGTWVIKAGERKGKPADVLKDVQFKDVQITFQDGVAIMRTGEREVRGTFRIDEEATPTRLQIMLKSGERVKVFPGVFEINDKALRLCLGTDDKEEPQEFKTRAGQHAVLFVLERAE